MLDLSNEKYEKWFQNAKEKIAAEKSAKLISYKEFDLSNEKYKEWKSAYEEQLQEMKQRMEESPLDPHKYSDSQRQLYFSSERGDLSLDQWRLNLYNSSEKKAQKAVLGLTPPSPDTISNDPDKELAITDIAGGTGVTTEFKEDTNLSENVVISSNNVNFAELPKNSDEILAIIPTNSSSVNDTEQSDNKEQYISDTDEGDNLDEESSVTISDIANEIDEEMSVDNILEALPSVTPSSTNDEYVVKCPAVDTKSPFASFVGVVTSVWHSLGKIFHKTKSTGDAVLDTSDSLPAKSSFVGDNLNDDVDTIGGISEVNNNLFDPGLRSFRFPTVYYVGSYTK